MRSYRLCALVLFPLFLTLTSLAQTFRGAINGTVSDTSGAAVVGADVLATRIDTGVIYKTASSSAGEFAFQDLPLGPYNVNVSAPGFQGQKVDGVMVSAGSIYSLPVKLSVATTVDSVEVSAAGLALDTTSAVQTTVLTNRVVEDTPMNGRDFTQLISVAPGFGGYSAGGFGSVNGTRANQVNWQIDGVDNNDLWHNIPAVNQGGIQGIAGVTLPLDSIEQYSQQTQSSPETGRNPGGTVNLVTKSGTNKLHGSVYYYNRNEALAANSPFATPNPAGKIVKNKLRNEQYGASIGGPILKDKWFYFANYEKQQFIIESPTNATEPSVAYQAQATALLAQYNVPVSSVATNLLGALWPANALTGPAQPNNYSNASPITGYSYNGVVKTDFNITPKHTLSARGYGGQGNQIAPVGTLLPYYFEEGPIHVFNYSAVLNSVLTPRLVNQVLVGVNYFNQVFFDANHSFNLAALGLNTQVGPNLSGAPGIKISGFDNLQHATPPSGRNDITGQITDAVSYSIGRHQYRFGGEFRRAQLNEFYHRKQRGTFAFDGKQGPWAGGSATACDEHYKVAPGAVPASVDGQTRALADFLAGCTLSAGIVRGDTERLVYVKTYDLFFQDAWQFNSKLNFNYGIRYDYLGPMHNDKKDLSVFRPSVGGSPAGFAFQGNQIGSLYPAAFNNFSPRVGFAYQTGSGGDIVVRGGFGVYFDEPNLNPFLDNRPPNGGASGAESNPAGPNPVGTLQINQLIITPNTPLFPTSAVFNPTQSYGLFSVNPNFRSAYNYNYSLNVEKSFGQNVIATLGYVGAQARKLLVIHDINQAALGTSGLSALDQNATRPFGKLFPNYGVINEIASIGTSNYNSLQATIRTTSWHRLTSQFSYTWGHGLDLMTQYRNALPQDSTNFKADYGNMDYDTRHNFVAYLLYDVPGSSHGPHWLINGWQANSLLTFHSGQPYSLFTGNDTSGTGEGEDRAVQVGDPFAGVSHTLVKGSGVVTWFNPSAFTNPTAGTFSSLRRNSLVAPGYSNVDLSVLKNFSITERVRAQFRVEMFNLFNRINLATPDNSVADGSANGTITTTIGNFNGAPGIGPGEPFNTQLALKIQF